MKVLLKKTTIVLLSFLLVSCGENSTTYPSKDGATNPSEEDNSIMLNSLSPTSGAVAGGTIVFINGANFTDETTVLFGVAACANLNFVSATQLTCVTPPNSTGSVSVTIASSGQTSVTQSNAFIYGNIPPTFLSVSPSSHINSQPTTITINGTGFVSGVTASIGGLACTSLSVNSGSQLTCVTPTGLTAGSYNVVVSNPGTGTTTGLSAFSFRTAPTLTVLKGSTNRGAFQTCQGCHDSGNPRGGLDISSYSSVRTRVISGDPVNSLMLERMGGIGPLMPPGGMRGDSELQALSDWILDGAQNN
jgi:hypothetical protein